MTSLRILLVDDEPIVHKTLGVHLEALGHSVAHVHDGRSALERVDAESWDLVLTDVRLPDIDGVTILGRIREQHRRLPVVLITGHGSMELAIEALRRGAMDFLVKPVKLLELEASVRKALFVRKGESAQRRAAKESSSTSPRGVDRFVGASSAAEQVREWIRIAAEGRCEALLVTGETGTGKEIVAQAFHEESCDPKSPYVPVSCPALPDTLVESELFGHERGAFTGASRQRAGRLELADGGTLFLDEVADLSSRAQAVLLRVLETRKFRRVGGNDEQAVDVRIVAATHRPLDQLASSGDFRLDLLFRLNQFSIHIPPLRERAADIIPLAEHFLRNYAAARDRTPPVLTDEARDALLDHEFPGNVRELRNIVERAAVMARGGPVEASHVVTGTSGPAPAPPWSPSGPPSPTAEALPDPAPSLDTEPTERDRIVAALETARWNRKRAAEKLGMPYSTLRYKMLKLNIR